VDSELAKPFPAQNIEDYSAILVLIVYPPPGSANADLPMIRKASLVTHDLFSQPIAFRLFWWPLLVFLLYVMGTFFVYLFGPNIYPDDQNRFGTLIFITTAMAVFAFGYWAGSFIPNRTSPSPAVLGLMQIVFRAGLIAGCVVGSVQFFECFHSGIGIEAVWNPGGVYRQTMTAAREVNTTDTSRIGQMAVLMAPLSCMALPVGLYSFRYLNLGFKAAVVAVICLPVVNGLLNLGTFKRVGDSTILIVSIIFLLACRRVLQMRKIKWWLLGIAAAFAIYFTFNQYSRLEAYNATEAEVLGQMRLNRQHVLFKLLGQEVGTGVAISLSYFSQGYYPLGLCLQLPFEWTGGLGHSFAAMGYAGQYFGINDVILHTYPLRLEAATGHSGLSCWHTIFPWLASDLTFPGSLLFMWLLGWFYARVLLEALVYANPLSIAVFCYLNIMLIFVPCNNQLFQQRESAVAMYSILLFWVFFHKNLNNATAIVAITIDRARWRIDQKYIQKSIYNYPAGKYEFRIRRPRILSFIKNSEARH
jgi:hypothetical protein